MSTALRARARGQTAAAVSERSVSSPYVGLVPFTEGDYEFFFGRAEESRNIAGRLRGCRLTLLYGPSGVGKSSVLRAGVVAPLDMIARHDLTELGAPDFAVVFFNEWTTDPLEALSKRIEQSVRRALGQEEIDELPPGLSLAQIIRAWTERYGIELLFILDQFEEYFLYHADEGGPGTFAHEFPEAVNDAGLRARFLISLRDDTLSKLDRFKGSIPALFDNRMQIEHLGLAAAYDAVVGPVKRYNELYAAHQPFRFDREFDEAEKKALRENVLNEAQPFLLNRVLSEVQVGKVSIGLTGQGVVRKDEGAAVAAAAGGAQPRIAIEAPYLQLVMTRVWRDEETVSSRELKVETLGKLGGSQKIVEQHLDKVMEELPEEDQDAAAAVFYYLVTPSGTKIAHTVETLAEWTKLPEERVRGLLISLQKVKGEGKEEGKGEGEGEAGGENKKEEFPILRRVNQKLGRDTLEAYEIYHDALAPAILAWSAKHKSELEGRREREAQRRKERRFKLLGGAIGVAFWLVAGAYYYIQSEHLQREELLRAEAQQREEALRTQQKGLEANAKTLRALVSLSSASTPAAEKDAAVKALQQQVSAAEINPEFAPLISSVLKEVAEKQPQTPTAQEAEKAARQITEQAQDTRIPPRVYINIQHEDQLGIAASLRQSLNESTLSNIPDVRPRIIAPGIERVGPRRGLEVSELRYFHNTDLERQIGEQLVQILNNAGLADVQLKLVGGYENNPNIRPNHFELWLSADVY